jgi:hypothetical protein
MTSKRSIFLLTVACQALVYVGIAQTKKTIQGNVSDGNSGLPIRSASIRNTLTGATVVSHSEGRFSLPVSKGNILAFSATGYYTDTLTVTDSVLALDKLIIGLRVLPATLPDVTITGRFSPYQLDSMERRRNFLALVGEREVPTVSRANDLGFGVGINLDRFSKKEKNRRAARSLFEVTEEEAYINYRWNDSVVNRYTRFTGDELTNFMQTFRPTWEWLRQHTRNDDMLFYINRSRKKYNKRHD